MNYNVYFIFSLMYDFLSLIMVLLLRYFLFNLIVGKIFSLHN